MTAEDAMDVVENPLEPMEDSSTSSSGDEGEGEAESGQEGVDESDQDQGEQEEKAANPAFSKFMQGFWDLASVEVPVRCVSACRRVAFLYVAAVLPLPPCTDQDSM